MVDLGVCHSADTVCVSMREDKQAASVKNNVQFFCWVGAGAILAYVGVIVLSTTIATVAFYSQITINQQCAKIWCKFQVGSTFTNVWGDLHNLSDIFY